MTRERLVGVSPHKATNAGQNSPKRPYLWLCAEKRRWNSKSRWAAHVREASPPRVFHRRTGIHDDIQTSCMGASGRGLVDHAQLKPDSLDAQPILLSDGFIDNGTDTLAVHKAVDDLHR